MYWNSARRGNETSFGALVSPNHLYFQGKCKSSHKSIHPFFGHVSMTGLQWPKAKSSSPGVHLSSAMSSSSSWRIPRYYQGCWDMCTLLGCSVSAPGSSPSWTCLENRRRPGSRWNIYSWRKSLTRIKFCCNAHHQTRCCIGQSNTFEPTFLVGYFLMLTLRFYCLPCKIKYLSLWFVSSRKTIVQCFGVW